MLHKSRHRRWLFVLAAIILLAGILWLILPMIVAPILRSKLTAQAAEHLDARLEMSSLWYTFPYTVRMTGVRLTPRLAQSVPIELLTIERLDLTLDQFPLRGGPLLIRDITLDRPELHLVHQRRLPSVIEPEAATTAPVPAHVPAPAEVKRKLSDFLRLRQLALREGKVIFEDRTRPDLPPMVWQNLATDLHIDPQSVSLYGFRIRSQAPPLAELSAQGSFDIDELLLSADRLALNVVINSADATSSPAPAAVTRFLQTYQINGRVTVDASGRVPLRDLPAGSFAASARLTGGEAHLPRFEDAIEQVVASVRFMRGSNQPEMGIMLDNLAAVVTGARMTVDRADGAINFDRRTWRLQVPEAQSVGGARGGSIELSASLAGPLERSWSWNECTATARLHAISLHPEIFDQPIDAISGTIRMEDGSLLFDNLGASYGNDAWTLLHARLPLQDLDQRIAVFDAAGEIRFNPPSPRYPKAVGDVIAQLKPAGAFAARGAFSIDPHSDDDRWDIIVQSEDGAFTATRHDIALSSVRGQANITHEQIDIRDLTASVFGGALAGSCTIDPRGSISYRGQLSLDDADVNELARHGLLAADSQWELSGTADGTASFSAESARLASLKGQGQLHVSDGELWEMPVLSHVTGQVKIAREALKAGELSADFSVADQTIYLQKGSLYSPALGLHGTGTIGFDGALNLDVSAALLGDWEQHIKRTNIPIMSDVLGNFVGAMQKALDTATSTLLYQFHVTGRASDPQVQPVPAPVLTESAAAVFQHMLRREREPDSRRQESQHKDQ